MFKSKLQELCHQKKWALPIYSCMKDGADHNPQFKASVVVNGINFDAATISKSLKEAHNAAAKLAFLLFTSDDKATVQKSNNEGTLKDSEMNSNALSNEAANFGGPKNEQALKDWDMNSTMSIEDEVQENYKMKLRMYAQRKKVGLLLYQTKKEEQSGALCFRATVTVGKDLFECPGSYKTAKHAENAAARAALMSLSMDAFRENDDCLYKNLLREFAWDNGYFFPEYKNVKYGEAHESAFLSTVELGGEIFHGNPTKSKKLAEINAAKVAYTAFMQRDNSSSPSKDEILKLAPRLDSFTFADHQRSSKTGSQVEETEDEDKGTDFTETKTAKFSNQEVIAGATLSGTDSSSEKTKKEIKTYLLCNRVRVYTCIPDVIFSKGNVALPIAEGKWVVVNLEFPKEKDA